MSAVHEHDDDHSVARDPGPAKRADEHEQVDRLCCTHVDDILIAIKDDESTKPIRDGLAEAVKVG